MAEAGRRALPENRMNLLEEPISPEEVHMAVRTGRRKEHPAMLALGWSSRRRTG
jgi:hypothetical protein